MHIVRTIVWVVLLVVLLAFSFFNWTPVEVRIWTNLVLETKLPALVVIAFLLGLVPMWLVHRGSRWRMKRRITALETVAARVAPPPAPATVSPDPLASDPPAPAPSPVNDPRDPARPL